ncbi:MAG: sodium/proline symporter PutP [Clostridia bacterium]|nr:sodium/proline symporter PutP [Clostridia bacterium]
MRVGELLAFILYFVAMLGVGFYFMFKSKMESESGYFLGGRQMGPFVTAMSAQASDMSGWLLMGLPGSILALGFGEVWIAIGLALGTYFNWLFIAGRLRKFSQSAGDSITIPQYLNNRFKSSGKVLQVVAAIIFLVCLTVYVASGFKAGAALFQSVLGIKSTALAMGIFAIIMLAYNFMGGFNAVCWTDFFQALLMLGAVVFVPVFISFSGLNGEGAIDFSSITATNPNYFNLLPSGKLDWESISAILSGLAWGLGYTGMPHILVRFMSIKSSKMIKTSRRVAMVWVVLTLAMAVFIAVVGRVVFPELITNGEEEMVFIKMVRTVFPAFISGIFLSAILAAAMSTADSQLLVASSAFTCDIYKPIINKNATEKQIMWMGRLVVIIISIVAFIIAVIPGSGNIMSLVENAWAGFGAAFGPVIILSLYWKKFTYKGAVSGMIAGGLTVVLWIIFLSKPTGLYELFPGFIVGMIACVVGSLLDKKDNSLAEQVYETAVKFEE